ncbi:YdeI/OmpD-associated family protein [Promicromonospora sp. Marseille-Q5078]
MRFRSVVEPAEKMKGLEVPPEVVEALGGGARPPVTITVHGHTWRSRVAIMRGRHLLGLSRANREAAGLEVGAEVEVELELDTEPREIVEPDDLARALDADPAARAAFDALPPGRRRRHVLDVEGAKQPATRARRIDKALAELHA